jgi:hypothetical protein
LPVEEHPAIRNPQLFAFSMRGVLPAEPAVLAQLETLGRLLLVLRRAVIPTLAVGARETDDVAHFAESSSLTAESWQLPATR